MKQSRSKIIIEDYKNNFIYKKNDQPAKKFMEIMTPKFRELVESN